MRILGASKFPLGVVRYVMMYCVSQHDAELTCCLFSGVYCFLFNSYFEPEITVNSGAFKLSHNCALGSVLAHPDQASLAVNLAVNIKIAGKTC